MAADGLSGGAASTPAGGLASEPASRLAAEPVRESARESEGEPGLLLLVPRQSAGVALELQYARSGMAKVVGHVVTAELSAWYPLAGRLELGARLPFVVAGIETGTGCCLWSPGNATLAVRSRLDAGGRATSAVGVSMSLPTAGDEGEAGQSALMAATVHLAHDAGLYLPKTTTARLDASLRFAAAPGWLQAQLGFHRWFRQGTSDIDIGQLRGAVGLTLTPRLSVVAAGSLAVLVAQELDLTGGLDLGIRGRAGPVVLGTGLYLPLDPFLLRSHTVGVAVELGSRF